MTLLYPLKKAFRRILLSSSPFSWAGFTPHLPLFIPRPTDRHSTWFWATPVTCLLGDAEYNEGCRTGPPQRDCSWLGSPHGTRITIFATRHESTSTLLAPSAALSGRPFLLSTIPYPSARDGLGNTLIPTAPTTLPRPYFSSHSKGVPAHYAPLAQQTHH
jgi:hypothetical protein